VQDEHQYYIVIAENVNGNDTRKNFFSNIPNRRRVKKYEVDNPQEPNEEEPTI